MAVAKSKLLENQSLIGSRIQEVMGNGLLIILKLASTAQKQAKIIQKISQLWKAIIELMSRKANFSLDLNSINKSLDLNNEAVPIQEKLAAIMKSDNRFIFKQYISITNPAILPVTSNLSALQKRQAVADMDNRIQKRDLRQGNMPQRASDLVRIISRQILRLGRAQQSVSVLMRIMPGQIRPDVNLGKKYLEKVPQAGLINMEHDTGKINFLVSRQPVGPNVRNHVDVKSIVEKIAIKREIIGFLNNIKPMLGMYSPTNFHRYHEYLNHFNGAKKNGPEMVGLTRGSQVFPYSRTQNILRGMGNENTGRPVKYSKQFTSEGNRNCDIKVWKEAGEQSYADFEQKSDALMERRRRLSFNGE